VSDTRDIKNLKFFDVNIKDLKFFDKTREAWLLRVLGPTAQAQSVRFTKCGPFHCESNDSSKYLINKA
jgi:hypothetical protein